MTHVATVTIDSAQVPADLTDFVVYIDLSDMPALFHSTVTASAGDIRCYKSDGTTELAREVVSYDDTADTGELHVKYSGTLSSSSDTEIQIHADGTSSDYAATATFGRNAVWSDYEVVLHLDDLTDSTGNTTPTQANTTSGQTGKIGQAFSFNGTDSRVDAELATILDEPHTFYGWFQRDTSDWGVLAGIADKDVTNQQHRIIANSGDSTQVEYSTFDGDVVNTAALSTSINTWHMFHAVGASQSDRRFFRDGTDRVNSGLTQIISGIDRLTVGTTADSTPFGFLSGFADEVRLIASTLSDDWITTEYNNQSSAGTFYTAVDPSGADFTLTANQGSFTLTGQAAGLTASRQLTANQGSYTLTGQDATLAFTKVLEAAQGSYSLSGQPAGLLASRTLTADQGSYTLSGQDATLTVTVTLDAEQGSYTLTGQDASLITSRLLEANQGSYSLTGQDATLTFQAAEISPLIAEQGSYSLTGQTADLVVSFKLDAVQGTYTLTGQDVDLIAQLVGDATGAVLRKVSPELVLDSVSSEVLTAKANDTTTAKVH